LVDATELSHDRSKRGNLKTAYMRFAKPALPSIVKHSINQRAASKTRPLVLIRLAVLQTKPGLPKLAQACKAMIEIGVCLSPIPAVSPIHHLNSNAESSVHE